MCGICGCNEPKNRVLLPLKPVPPKPVPVKATTHLVLETSLLAKNDALATENRNYFLQRGLLAINLVSGPGAGKTTLLEATARYFREQGKTLHVIEGDQQTDNDAQRVRAAGAIAHQINTGHLCHLEAMHIARSLQTLPPCQGSTLVIENVGNLVCPASFDLGEQLRVVVISTPEGDDKPLKYPDILLDADLLIISKSDLAPYVDFDSEKCIAHALSINSRLQTMQLSVRSGAGFDQWLTWLDQQRQQYDQESDTSDRR